MHTKKTKLAELMEEIEFLENNQLAERRMTEEKLTKARSSQAHESIQNETSSEDVTPK